MEAETSQIISPENQKHHCYQTPFLGSQELHDGFYDMQPIVPVQVSTMGPTVTIPFLLDSGAAFTTLPMAVADRGQIDYDTVHERPAKGAFGGAICYLNHMMIRIGTSHLYKIPFYVYDSKGVRAPALLGRVGVLDNFAFVLGDWHVTVYEHQAGRTPEPSHPKKTK